MELNNLLKDGSTVAIAGHIRPDGDCVSSCMALYNYITENYHMAAVDIFLDDFAEPLKFMANTDKVQKESKKEILYDLFFVLDSGDEGRIGAGKELFKKAKKRICIDHHISNQGYGDENLICPEISATAEVLYRLFEKEKISKAVAECLYTGIVHDTGVFQYTNVSPDTLRIAAHLIEYGLDFSAIISRTFYEKTYKQNRILGYALANSVLFMDGRCIFSVIRLSDMKQYEIGPMDMEGIVASLRNTAGVECAIFLYETNAEEYRVSLRSKSVINVGEIASYFNGGGHIRAAGCTMNGSVQDVLNNISRLIERQFHS